MAFLWSDICSVNLANTDLVEDLVLGLDLALNGKFSRFCPEAIVISEVAAEGTPNFAQRARWEHGAMAAAMRYAPLLIRKFCKTGNVFLITMMLDLVVPPLALLSLLVAGNVTLTAAAFLLGTSLVPLCIAGAIIIFFIAAIGLAWWSHGQEVVALRTLALAPAYAMAKIPLYLHFFGRRQTEWVRGKRSS
jgi:cellulose synthase/poly-beta-1,6-N-acetylglucosamine synthase-like glycosyltransferase